MINKLTTFSLQDIQPDTIRQSLDSFQMTSDYAVAKGLRFAGNPYVKSGILLLLKEARVGIVSAGDAIVEIDLTEYHVTKGMIILLPHDTIVNIRSASNDYALNGTVLLPTINVDETIILSPDDDVHQDTVRIYETLCAFCQNHPDRKNVIEHLQRAIVDNVRVIQTAINPRPTTLSSSNRGEELLHKFKVLVSHNARRERKVSFYADKLCVTPKYLSKVIKDLSGKSGPQWIDEFVILSAKNMLRHSDISIKEIANYLNFPSQSFFFRFFNFNILLQAHNQRTL